MSSIDAMAKTLGQDLGRTDEYRAVKQAAAAVNDDRDLVELRNKLEKLESELVVRLRSGKEPDETSRRKYESLAEDLQARSAYQRLVASQANFDKVLQRVNDIIAKGIQEGASNRIILPS